MQAAETSEFPDDPAVRYLGRDVLGNNPPRTTVEASRLRQGVGALRRRASREHVDERALPLLPVQRRSRERIERWGGLVLLVEP